MQITVLKTEQNPDIRVLYVLFRHSAKDHLLGTGFKRPEKLYRVSLVAQLVKNPPRMQETPIRFLGQEDLLEKG